MGFDIASAKPGGGFDVASAGAGNPEEKEHGKLAKANDFREGLWSSVVDTGYGINELVTGDLRPDQREYAEDLRRRSQESGWGTGGRVVGEIGMLMAPGGALGAAGKALTKLPKAARAAKAAAAATKGLKYDVAASAGLGAAQLPSDPSMSRTENALWGAGGALGGAALAKTMGVMGQGVKRSKAGQRMLDKDVRLTPGRASEGTFLGAAENLMRVAPFTAKGTNKFQERAFRDWNKQMFNEVAPKGVKITSDGHAGFTQLQTGFNNAYDDAWGLAGKPSNEGLVSVYNQAVKAGKELPGSAEYAMKQVLNGLGKVTKEYTPKGLKALDSTLRDLQEGAYGGVNPEKYLGDAIKNIRTTLRDSVGKESQDALAKVDAQWSQYLPVKEAGETAKAVSTKGLLDTDMVGTAIGGKGGTGGGRQLTGDAPFQSSLNDAIDTIGEKDPNMILNIMKATAAGAPSPHGLMDFMGRGLTGQTKAQKFLRPGYEDASIQSLIDSLRTPTAGKVGGAYANE